MGERNDERRKWKEQKRCLFLRKIVLSAKYAGRMLGKTRRDGIQRIGTMVSIHPSLKTESVSDGRPHPKQASRDSHVESAPRTVEPIHTIRRLLSEEGRCDQTAG